MGGKWAKWDTLMVNTSEMVEDSKRIEIVDKYASKLINSETPWTRPGVHLLVD